MSSASQAEIEIEITATSSSPRPLLWRYYAMVKSVLIAEDHALTRHALCSLFASQEDFEREERPEGLAVVLRAGMVFGY